MISFYPGPSRIWDETATWVKEACDLGLLSVNHRSKDFAAMLSATTVSLKSTLQIPDEYEIFFTSSATETWEMILQSLPIRASAHYFNGAFGEKWYDYATWLAPKAEAYPFEINEEPVVHFTSADLICITHNETSNATQLSRTFLEKLRKSSEGQLIAVDATSSMAGVSLPWKMADIWYASVQKCFGLPAGLCVVVTSPAAAERAFHLHKSKHYNGFTSAIENARKGQTTHTPNVLGIWLCGKAMEKVKSIIEVEKSLLSRKQIWYDFFISKGWESLIQNPECQSQTVLAVKGEAEWIGKVKSETQKAGFMLGNGYGKWKDTTFRIANFPALQESEHQKLIELLRSL